MADIPAGLASLDHFSARWQGNLIASEDGDYELGLDGDDGYRLILDGKTVIDNWSKGAQRYRSAIVSLHKGQSIPIAIDYFQGDGNRSLSFGWHLPSERAAMKAGDGKLDLAVSTYLPKGAELFLRASELVLITFMYIVAAIFDLA